MFKVKTKYYTHKHKILPKIQNENLFSYYSGVSHEYVHEKKYRILLLPTFKGAKLGGAWVTIDCTFYIQFDLFSTIALPAKW